MNPPFSCIIIEDEPLNARGLAGLLEQLAPNYKVIASPESVAGARKWLKENPAPDLIFMDVQLGDGLSFELLDEIDLHVPVIFITAYDEYALRAFQLNSVSYLLKPIDETDLAEALRKFERTRSAGATGLKQQLSELLKELGKQSDAISEYKERFMVHEGKSLVPIQVSEISCFMKKELIFLVARDGQKYLVDFDTLDSLEQVLDPKIFFRANRQYIIHINMVAQVKPHFSGKLLVQLKQPANMSLEISREKAAAFKQWLS